MIDLGKKVQYKASDGRWRSGIVQAIKTIERPGDEPNIHSYLVDNGKTVSETELFVDDETQTIRVPETVEVVPNDIKLLS